MSQASLATKGLIFRFPSSLFSRKTGFSVGPIDLDLGPGLHYLRGQNGAGKSTLLRCLCGGLRRTEGAVDVCGLDVERPAARAQVALVPGRPSLPTYLTVDESWQLLAGLRGAPGWDGRPLREALGLPGHIKLSAASDGQARKAELLAALAGDPPVLLLDEPLALMDAATVALLSDWVEGWRANRVVLATSHEALPFAIDSEATLVAGQPLRWTGR